VLADIAAHDDSADGWDAEEVALVLRIAGPTATSRLAEAVRLRGPLRSTWSALAAGRITARHATVLAQETRHLDDPVAIAVQDRVLARAEEQPLGRFRAAVRRAVHALDPAGQQQRHVAAAEQRRVIITPDEDGMAQLWALLPAPGAATIRAALNALAAQADTAADLRTADQLRADALVQLADAALADPALPRQHGRRPTVHVTLAASTLIGADDRPAELAGYGPITAATARELATEPGATWRRLITDDRGRLVRLDPATYRPTQALRDFVILRDQRCTFPGCAHPAQRCDLDHRDPAARGGVTDPANLHPLCRHHHRAKHQAGWRPSRTPDGTTRWASPTDHCYRSRPTPLPTTAPESPPPY
jgi:hypothetical protein